MLDFQDPRVAEFFAEVDKRHPFKVGMDSCNVSGTIRYCKKILPESLDTCESGRYRCYISTEMYMTPCSFDQDRRYYVPLQGSTIEEAGNSESFKAFAKECAAPASAVTRRDSAWAVARSCRRSNFVMMTRDTLREENSHEDQN